MGVHLGLIYWGECCQYLAGHVWARLEPLWCGYGREGLLVARIRVEDAESGAQVRCSRYIFYTIYWRARSLPTPLAQTNLHR